MIENVLLALIFGISAYKVMPYSDLGAIFLVAMIGFPAGKIVDYYFGG